MPLEARVKSVLSGDTVVLSHVTNPGQERTLSLAYVSAPRLKREGDEVRYLFLSLVSVLVGCRLGACDGCSNRIGGLSSGLGGEEKEKKKKKCVNIFTAIWIPIPRIPP